MFTNLYLRRYNITSKCSDLDLLELFGANLTGINFDKYDDISVEVTGDDSPAPVEEFTEGMFCEIIAMAIQLANYTKPTPVQKHAIPIIAAGRDVMACAQVSFIVLIIIT